MPSPDPALTPAERNRLVGILSRLESPFDGERAAAGLLAVKMLKKRGLGWHQVIGGQAVQLWRPAPAAPPTAGSHAADLAFCARHRDALDEWSAGFVASLGRQRRPLSPKQASKLAEIVAKLRARGLA